MRIDVSDNVDLLEVGIVRVRGGSLLFIERLRKVIIYRIQMRKRLNGF